MERTNRTGMPWDRTNRIALAHVESTLVLPYLRCGSSRSLASSIIDLTRQKRRAVSPLCRLYGQESHNHDVTAIVRLVCQPRIR